MTAAGLCDSVKAGIGWYVNNSNTESIKMLAEVRYMHLRADVTSSPEDPSVASPEKAVTRCSLTKL